MKPEMLSILDSDDEIKIDSTETGDCYTCDKPGCECYSAPCDCDRTPCNVE